ncbi:MAG: response regulator [Gammaproteobacteria bacterium]
MSPRVLVVDDEPFIVTGLRTFLEDEGMHVDSAGSGEEAVDIVRNDSGIDVCIMDIRLPGMNGDTTIRALYEICPDLRFIIHTGSADYSIPDDLRAIGINERQLFAKPLLDMMPLAETVTALAGTRD